MPNPEKNPRTFGEVLFQATEQGIQVSTNLRIPQHLDHKSNQSMLNQPPLNFMQLEESLVPSDFFREDLDEDEAFASALRNLIRDDVRRVVMTYKPMPSELIQLHKLAEEVVNPKYIGPELKAVQTILRGWINYLESFPLLIVYLREMWKGGGYAYFDKKGFPILKNIRGQTQISTYAFYYASRRPGPAPDSNAVKFYGLEDVLPAGLSPDLENDQRESEVEVDPLFYQIYMIVSDEAHESESKD